MNKLLFFPLGVMFIVTMFSVVYSGNTYMDTYGDYSDSGTLNHSQEGEASVELPDAVGTDFNIWDFEQYSTGALVILIAAIAIGIVAGVRILGSGLSETSQTMLFSVVLFLGLWACLTVIADSVLFANIISTVIWLVLTMLFVLGLGVQLAGSSDAV